MHLSTPCAGPRAKPVISEEALQELDANREDAPAALPPSLLKVGEGGRGRMREGEHIFALENAAALPVPTEAGR